MFGRGSEEVRERFGSVSFRELTKSFSTDLKASLLRGKGKKQKVFLKKKK